MINDNREDDRFARLLDWLEGQLPEEEARQVQNWLEQAGKDTREDLAWLQEFLDTADVARAPQPPPEVRAALLAEFKEFTSRVRAPSFLERMAATLSFDSGSQLAFAGARSGPALGKPRQLIYDSEIAEIAINIRADQESRTVTLSGQIYPKTDISPAGFSVQILEADGFTERGIALSDDLGEFLLGEIPEGRYGLFLCSDTHEISLPEIHLHG